MNESSTKESPSNNEEETIQQNNIEITNKEEAKPKKEYFDNEGNKISKHHYKRLLKQQKLKEHWIEKKKKKKENKKLKAEQRSTVVTTTPEVPIERRMSRKEWKAIWEERYKKGQQIIIDCSFEDLMEDYEVTSLSQQIMFSYGLNHKSEHPFKLYVTSFKGKVKERLEKISGFTNWTLETSENPFEQLFPKEQLVYFTADSTEDLIEFDQNKVYVIGGIVDRNRYKQLTFNKAKELGIQTVRLPLHAIEQLSTSRVLTVNNMFEILHLFQSCGDWDEAIAKGLPSRKQNIDKSETENQDLPNSQ